jgi:hypothetical protein
MKKHFALFLASTLLFAACQKQITNPISDTSFNKFNHLNSNRPLSTRGAFDVLGYGYDVTAQYCSPSAVINQVINASAFNTANPTRISIDSSTSQTGVYNSASNAITYTSSLAVALKDQADFFSFFKGSISVNFTDQYAFSSRFVYGTYDLDIRQKRIYFNTPEATLLNYLSTNFVQDVASQTPQYIVQHYGTHVLTDCIEGAKLDVIYRSETHNSNSKAAGSVGINGSLKILGTGITTKDSLSYSSSSANNNFNQSLTYSTFGGNPNQGLFNTVTFGGKDSTVTINVTAWQNTSTPNNSVLIDITAGTLIPIWELVQDPAKSAALKAYVIQYVNSNSINLLNDNYPETILYRYRNTSTGDHLETTNPGEVSGQKNWSLDGQQGYIYTTAEPGLVPLYRYFINGYHFCTTNLNEVPTQQPELVVGYVDTQSGLAEQPIYRFFAKSSGTKGHIYTTSASEYSSLLSGGQWSYEGITGYISQ